MDLTKSFPASVKTELFGVVQLQRAIDKGVAKAKGNIGEYHYNCPMDAKVFEFLGLDHEALLSKLSGSTEEIRAYVKPYVEKKSAAELEAFNKAFVAYGPEAGSDGEGYFLELRSQVAPSRTDVTAWADLLDLDEKREVPQRVAA
jgi:hypothetical protein